MSFIAPDLFRDAPAWSPQYFTGPATRAIQAGRAGATLEELGAKLVEGWRVSETPGTAAYDPVASAAPIYRQSNIQRMQLLLAEEHWAPPQFTARWCVEPGDVVLNKIAPIRAALVPPLARRHPVDGNNLIVRGLPLATATWLAVCLNRAEYEQLLLIESGVLRRLGLRTLAALRLPPVPAEVGPLSRQLREVLDELLLVGESLQRLKREAAALVVAPGSPHNLREGAFFVREAVSNESWLPAAVDFRAEQALLAEDLAWAPVRALATADDRSRLQSAPKGARLLRLSDVGEDLLVAPREREAPDAEVLVSGRTLSKPLIPGDVLLSTLGASFRAAYVDEGVPPNSFPTDGWVRLRFRETPAAWALLLSTHHVRGQTARLAVGSVQQFVPPEALLSIHLPTPERETREHWQRAVQRHHAQRRALDHRRNSLLTSLVRTFDDVHGVSASRPLQDLEAQQ